MGEQNRNGLSVLCGLLTVSCGPSFESLNESDVRFEHCNRLDLDSAANDDQRRRCWEGWDRDYIYGQTRDRVEYGRRRARELNDPAPPPDVSSSDQSGASAPASESGPASESECASACRTTHQGCAQTCASAPTGCTACDAEYGECQARCSSDTPSTEPLAPDSAPDTSSAPIAPDPSRNGPSHGNLPSPPRGK